MSSRRPVTDWMRDFDHYDPRWIDDPFTLWAEMRQAGEVATTQRYGRAFCPLTWDGIRHVASTPDTFSSRRVELLEWGTLPPNFAPPMTSDPPHHRAARALLSKHLSASRVNALEIEARSDCRALVAGIAPTGAVDAVAGYARPAVARTLSRVLGVAAQDIVSFLSMAFDERISFARSAIAAARSDPDQGLVTHFLQSFERGEIPDEAQLVGHVFLMLIAGLDTTAGIVSSALLHLAEHDDDQALLRDHADRRPAAIEEFLRVFAPVTTARVVMRDAKIEGCPVAAGDRVLLPFAVANRDPSRFPDPDRVMPDRPIEPNATFGFGIHHCAGAKLARMLIGVALDEWLDGMARFRRGDRGPFAWTTSGVRALRSLPLAWDARGEARPSPGAA